MIYLYNGKRGQEPTVTYSVSLRRELPGVGKKRRGESAEFPTGEAVHTQPTDLTNLCDEVTVPQKTMMSKNKK